MTVNLFETTIRVLGGLQSAFVLSGGSKVFLWRAIDLGLRLSVRHWHSHLACMPHEATALWQDACWSRNVITQAGVRDRLHAAVL